MKDETPIWHIVWWTHGVWPPWDRRGSWAALRDLYAQLPSDDLVAEYSQPLQSDYTDSCHDPGRVLLREEGQTQLRSDILDLTRPDGDRVAGNIDVYAIAITQTETHLVAKIPEEQLQQRVGRLKSRTATLLSFRSDLGVGGSRTWGRGFWFARLNTSDAVGLATTYVQGLAAPRE